MHKRHFLSIDIIRFMAAIAVALFHLGFKAFVNADDHLYKLIPTHSPPQWAWLCAFGWIGVQIFFVISGFVIAYSAEGESVGAYAKRRFLRLVPAIWIAVPICSFVALVGFHEPAEGVGLHALRTLAFIPFTPWIIGQFWTLPIEIVFYFCVGVLIARHRVDRLESFAAGLAVMSSAYWIAYGAFHIGGHGQRLWQLMLFQHGVFFAIGITIYRASIAGLTLWRLAFLSLCCVPAFFQISWASQWEAIGIAPQIREWGAFGIWLIFTSFILICAVTKDWRVNDKLTLLIRGAGAATYPLYLLHNHVGGWVLISLLAIGTPTDLSIASALLVTIIIAVWMSLYAEPFVRGRLSHMMDWVSPKVARIRRRL